jgi:hypothetical protein
LDTDHSPSSECDELLETEYYSEQEMSPPPSPVIDPVLYYFKTSDGERVKGFRGNPDTVIDNEDIGTSGSSNAGLECTSDGKDFSLYR